MARNYAALLHEYRGEMAALSDAEFGRLCRALLDYSADGTTIALSGNERFYAARVMTQEDRYQQAYNDLIECRRDAGRKGGEAKSSKAKLSQANDSKTPYNKTETKTEINPVTNVTGRDTRTREAPARHKYGQYDNVLLSDEDLSKLQSEFPTDWEARIERLSEYMAYKGVSYKSHLATIRAWAKKDAQQQSQQPTQKEESFAELAARMAQKGVR